MKMKEENGKVGLKLNLQKTKITCLVPSLHANRWGNNLVTHIVFWAPESLQMVTAAMKLKEACPLEEKL